MNTLIRQSKQGAYSVTEVDVVDEEKIAEMENAKLVYSPEFIPFYIQEVKRYQLTNTEGLVYGFIRFYLSTNPDAKFYFTNDQLANMLGVGPSTISNSVSKIVKLGLFAQKLMIKANGGTFRLLTNSESDYEKLKSPTLKNLRANKNKINENNISKDIGDESPVYGSKDINRLISGINKYLDLKLPVDGEARRYAHNALKLLEKNNAKGEIKVGREFMSDDKWVNAREFLAEYKNVKIDKGFSAQSWRKINENIKLWIANEGELSTKFSGKENGSFNRNR